MPTLEQDRAYFEAALSSLKKYLLSDILFYPLTGSLPRLTLGGLLLAKRRLDAGNHAPHLTRKLAAVKEKWRAAWTKKAATELDARLTLWRNYLSDVQKEPEEYATDYPREVRWRVMLALLVDEAEQTPPELTVLDQRLHTQLRAGEFIWDDSLKSEFDRKNFWFLYGNLR